MFLFPDMLLLCFLYPVPHALVKVIDVGDDFLVYSCFPSDMFLLCLTLCLLVKVSDGGDVFLVCSYCV